MGTEFIRPFQRRSAPFRADLLVQTRRGGGGGGAQDAGRDGRHGKTRTAIELGGNLWLIEIGFSS